MEHEPTVSRTVDEIKRDPELRGQYVIVQITGIDTQRRYGLVIEHGASEGMIPNFESLTSEIPIDERWREFALIKAASAA